jgi:hypothetical protein
MVYELLKDIYEQCIISYSCFEFSIFIANRHNFASYDILIKSSDVVTKLSIISYSKLEE